MAEAKAKGWKLASASEVMKPEPAEEMKAEGRDVNP
jgi:hypothetical protein